MKILQIMFAGAYNENFTYQDNLLPRCQKKLGHDVIFVANCWTFQDGKEIPTKPCDYVMADGVRLVRLPYKHVLNGFLTEKLRDAMGLAELLEKESPDVIMIHDPHTVSVDTVCTYLRSHPNSRLVVDNHIDAHNSAKNLASKYVLHRLIYKKYVREAARYARHFYVLTDECRQFAIENYGLSDDKIELLPLGGIIPSEEDYNSNRVQIRKALNLEESDVLLIHSGKLTQGKKTDLLLDAFSQVPEKRAHLVVIGTVPEENKELEAKLQIAQEQDSRVHYVGWKSGSELAKYLCAGDIYVQPGTQSATMQNAACSRCALVLYPYTSHKALLGNTAYYAADEDQLVQVLTELTQSQEKLEESRRQVFSLAGEKLDYMRQAEQILE